MPPTADDMKALLEDARTRIEGDSGAAQDLAASIARGAGAVDGDKGNRIAQSLPKVMKHIQSDAGAQAALQKLLAHGTGLAPRDIKVSTTDLVLIVIIIILL